jgi:thiamine pyrophosphate-dependent acetolactate synthase large subunit-like protein
MTQTITIGNVPVQVMNRFDLSQRLVRLLKNDEAIVAGIGNTNFDLWAAGRRPQNFYMLGSMGLAFPIALGVAIAQPQRHVIGLEGDGSLLMQLGALATIAAHKARNLTMIVWDNQSYQITGSQPTATAGVADIVDVARGCGIKQSLWARSPEDFEAQVTKAIAGGEKTLIAAKTDNDQPHGQTHRDPVLIRENFMQGLGVRSARTFAAD